MTDRPTSFDGTFQRRPILDTTRSERQVPVLVVIADDGTEEVVRVHVVGDESYEEKALEPFVGRNVRVGPGTWRNRVLRVSSDAVVLVEPDSAPKGEGT